MPATYPVPGYPYLVTARPQGTNLTAGQVDIRDVNARLLSALEAIGMALQQPITIISGYRTDQYSQAVGGFAGDPHTRGVAVDAYVGSTPIGNIPAATRLFASHGLISGNQPNFYHGKPDPPHVQMAAASTTGGSTTSGVPAGWQVALLRALRAPVTARNLAFLNTWQHYEGGSASFNPLNTTQPAAGATNYNSAGVKNYPNAGVGIQATVQTLTSGRYNDIVTALQSGDPWKYGHRESIGSELRTWGTTHLASLWIGGDIPPAGINPSDTPLATAGAAATHIPGVVQIQSIGDAISWLGDNWDRVLEVIGGSALLIVGLLLLGKQMMGSARGSDITQLADALKQNAQQRSTARRAREDEALYQETKRGNEQQRQQDRATVRRNRRTPSRAQVPAAVGQSDDIPY